MSKVSCTLNFMYAMEQFATRIYLLQMRAFRNTETAGKLTAASANEQTHVNFLRARLLEMKYRPSRLGFLFRLAAIILGWLTGCLGKSTALRAAIFVETRAVKDYGSFAKKPYFDTATKALLEQIIADEVQHVNTWKSELAALKK